MTRKKRIKQPNTTQIPIKDTNLEIRVVKQATKEFVAFDFALLFTEGTNKFELYLDDHLKEALEGLLKIHGKLIVKTNIFSPDVVLVTPQD